MSLPDPCYIEPCSGTRYPLTDRRWRSDDKKPLLISPLPGISPADIDTGKRSLWRYGAALPVDISDPVSLGEGCTPLIEKTYGSTDIHFKLEWFLPTGSFKDSGASVMISLLRQLGISHIMDDSSGNGGASAAAYGAAAGFGVRIFTPASTSPGKTTQIRAYGAEVQSVPGPREASELVLMRQTEESDRYFYASHNWHPFFLQGINSVGYELWENLGFRAPDNIIMPVGAGGNVIGCDIAFNELKRAGQIDRLPRIFLFNPKTAVLFTPISKPPATSPWRPNSPQPLPKGPPLSRRSGCRKFSLASIVRAEIPSPSKKMKSAPQSLNSPPWDCMPNRPHAVLWRRWTGSLKQETSSPAKQWSCF